MKFGSSVMRTHHYNLGSFQSRRFLSKDANYITTPIFYVNAKPHLGHFYSMTLADVQNRWTKFNNRETFFTTGTDEHGLKVQAAAAKVNTDPKKFCDGLAEKFKDLARLGEVDYDRFIRTTDPDHLIAVNHFWKTVWDKGYIYKGQHSGWYSVSDEAFYTERDIEEVVDEKTGEKKMASKETGSEVNFESEENYFFKMSQFQKPLIEYFEAHREFVQPDKYYQLVLNELKEEELPDLSISRPSWRLSWGIPVPNDDSQKIYVWFDALINYLTSIGYPNNPQLTPATHLIGKDITRFHCIHWPIFLMAADLPLPRRVVVHGHWLMGGRKMSKSRGNVADPVEISEYYDTDALRLFMMRNSVLTTDCDYSEEKVNNTRNEFIDKFCNMVTRGLSKNFDIEGTLVRIEQSSLNSMLNSLKNSELEKELKGLYEEVNGLPKLMDENVSDFRMLKPLDDVWEVVRRVNLMFETYKPWSLKIKKENSEEQNSALQLEKQLIVFSALDAMRCIFILLQPFVPNYSALLLDRLHVAGDRRGIEYAQIGADLTYGRNAVHKKNDKVPLSKLEMKQ
ncbi:DEKNAAC102492 [Brettanomyces naardenensis]|uniref:Methionine--tRNA ligase, mitochondrial n=1 Tax=Brettanomyces naardenensis TaxID=13370 RepID=A0A448YL89_BRENA|nr:DEKNAAC102492 [Brettanomyces naardenensis]